MSALSLHRAALLPRPGSEQRTAAWFVELLRRRLAARPGDLLPGLAAISFERKELMLIDVEGNRAVVGPAGTAGLAVLRHALSRNVASLAIESVSRDRFETFVACNTCVPLLPLLWRSVMEMHKGDATPRPLSPLAPEWRLRMARWPDFRVLAHRHDDFRLCSLLLKRAFTVAQCSQMLGIDRVRVQAFFNAAYFTGYADRVDSDEAAAASPTPELRGNPAAAALLARLWRGVRTRLGH